MTQSPMLNEIKQGYYLLPKALRLLLLINVSVFIVSIFGVYPYLLQWFGYIPEIGKTLTEPWRIVSYTFVHSLSNPFHVVFNMLILWFFGKPVEQAMGTRSFTALYFISAIGGALIQMIFSHITGSGLNTPVIGASGAVMGVSVAFAYLYPNTQVLFLFIPMPAKYLVLLFFLMDVLFIGSGDNVARLVHIGGFLVAFGLMYARSRGYDAGDILGALVQSAKSKPKEQKRPTNPNLRKVEDAVVVDDKAQEEIDRILDKISKTGYNGLTDEEKKTLFELSKRK